MTTFVHDHTAMLGPDSWTADPGTPTVLSFSFETAALPYIGELGQSTAFNASFQPFTEAQQQTTREALDIWAAASGVVFIEVAAGEGDLRFLSTISISTPPTRIRPALHSRPTAMCWPRTSAPI